MKNWIEVHAFTEGNPVLVNLDNVTCVVEDKCESGAWIFVARENDDEGVNIHSRESYTEVKDLIIAKGGVLHG